MDSMSSQNCTVGQITIFLDINRIRHKMVKNAIKVGNLRRKTREDKISLLSYLCSCRKILLSPYLKQPKSMHQITSDKYVPIIRKAELMTINL